MEVSVEIIADFYLPLNMSSEVWSPDPGLLSVVVYRRPREIGCPSKYHVMLADGRASNVHCSDVSAVPSVTLIADIVEDVS